jgi:type I restriction enzyme S subunit
VLKQAFEGRLVPRDPDDEPASVLLERIRKERERKEQEKHVYQMRLPGT